MINNYEVLSEKNLDSRISNHADRITPLHPNIHKCTSQDRGTAFPSHGFN